MTAPDPARRLATLVKKTRPEPGAPAYTPPATPDGGDAIVQELLLSFLMWEAGPGRAEAALKRLLHTVVDYNELRVCLPDELADAIGDRFPRALERCARLRSALNDIYRREHAVALQRLHTMPKRDAWQYLASLEGVPGFVAARVTLLPLGGHAFPLDERLHAALRDEKAIPPELTVDEASGWLERQFHAGEAAPAYLAIEGWAAQRPAPKAPRRPPAPRARRETKAEP